MIKFKNFMVEGVDDPAIFKAVFLAGGPGSGKSFIAGKTGLTSLGLKLVNSDDAFERMLKKAGMEPTPKNMFSPKGQEIRQKAKTVTGMRQKGYIGGRLGLVIDGTGKDFGKIQKQATALKKLGYDVAMIFVNTDLETAQRRNKMRARSLPTAAVTGMWKDVQNNLGKFQNFFNRGSEMIIVDNSEESDSEGAILGAYRKMSAWVKRPPTSPAAKQWIKKEREAKRRD